MAREVYFAFHYQQDIWRVNVIRNSDITQEDRKAAGFYDGSLWEEAKKEGDEGIKRMINNGLRGTTVTVFLLGEHTANRPWVKYELERSWSRGNGLVSIFIHNIKNSQGYTSNKGSNILDNYNYTYNGMKYNLSTSFKTYDWVYGDGYENFGDWVEEAVRIADDLKSKGIMPT